MASAVEFSMQQVLFFTLLKREFNILVIGNVHPNTKHVSRAIANHYTVGVDPTGSSIGTHYPVLRRVLDRARGHFCNGDLNLGSIIGMNPAANLLDAS